MRRGEKSQILGARSQDDVAQNPRSIGIVCWGLENFLCKVAAVFYDILPQ
jgi:hypothetical protein